MCAGYEAKVWRAEQLAKHLMEWLPEFALRPGERENLGAANALRLVAKAARLVFNAAKADTKSRGEIGEMLLHVAVRQVFKSEPAVTKYYYKDSANDTVKGFDSVHAVGDADDLELWLGESKFYKDAKDALREAIKSVGEHVERDYLRSEFMTITNKMDDSLPYADRLRRLMDPNTSLDDVFDAVTIPVFVAFESPVLGRHMKVTEEFIEECAEEATGLHETFKSGGLPGQLKVHLFLLPMHEKQKLIDAFTEQLDLCQKIAN